MLTEKDRLNYLRDGYILIRSFLGGEQLSCLQSEADYLFNTSTSDVTMNQGCVLQPVGENITHKLKSTESYRDIRLDLSDEASDVLKLLGGDLADAAKDLLPASENLLLFNEQYIIKSPGLGNLTRFDWHRDGYHLSVSKCFKPFVSCWIALDATNSQNGALLVAPYSNEPPISNMSNPLSVYENPNKYMEWHLASSGMTQQICQPTLENCIPIYNQPGDVIFISPFLNHCSGPNESSRFRRAYLAQYSSEPITRYCSSIPISLVYPVKELSCPKIPTL